MYGIYGNIDHQYTPNVSINLPNMDPMGNASKANGFGNPVPQSFEPGGMAIDAIASYSAGEIFSV